ncbi:hypothetical protein [Mesorhizobium sp. Pch-S]|uniref:hypothetical protein n=1 Tax=Mesorhizobium sp. Pch-S TaxID=2082387 RepID=UPI0010108B45|nr:hypothetical protein [Mesorhizobium sp. Pch-S]QAZ46764.1 hypothetical protein C1M53_31415 [Mesorhizobium sp. Pch-S]
MSNFVQNNCRVLGTHLTGTTNTTVLTATGYTQVIGVRLSNITSSDKTASVGFYSISATDEYKLLFQHIVPANSAVWLPLDAFALNVGDEIRVQASAANSIDVVTSIAEVPGRSG